MKQMKTRGNTLASIAYILGSYENKPTISSKFQKRGISTKKEKSMVMNVST